MAAADPALWAEWDAYRAAPDAPRSPVERVGPDRPDGAAREPVRRARCSSVDGAAGELRAQHARSGRRCSGSRSDFVRKRVAAAGQGRRARAPRSGRRGRGRARWPRRSRTSTASARSPRPAARCSTARRRSRAEGSDADKAALAAEIDALKRWCASCLHDPAFRGWVTFRFPETLDYQHLVQVQRPRPELPEAMIGPDAAAAPPRRLRAHRPALDAARGAERDRLLRPLPRARQGLVLEGASRQGRQRSSSNPLGIPLAGCPLDEKISEMHMLRKARRRDRRAGHRRHRQPDVPGHRPPHLQRLHEGLHLPEAGAGQHPADRDRRAHRRARAAVGLRDLRPAHALEPAQRPPARTRCPTTGRNVLVVGLGPAGYTLAHYLLNEGFGVVGDRRPEDRAASPAS